VKGPLAVFLGLVYLDIKRYPIPIRQETQVDPTFRPRVTSGKMGTDDVSGRPRGDG